MPRLIARSIASFVICADLALATTVRSAAFTETSPPPSRAATSKSRDNLANVLPRTLSIAAFLCLIVAHLEWPDIC